MKHIAKLSLSGIALVASLSACTDQQVGTGLGAAGGAAVGYAVTGGDALGTAVGAGVGGLIGNQVGAQSDRERYYRHQQRYHRDY